MKDVRDRRDDDDDRENGANGDDRKGEAHVAMILISASTNNMI